MEKDTEMDEFIQKKLKDQLNTVLIQLEKTQEELELLKLKKLSEKVYDRVGTTKQLVSSDKKRFKKESVTNQDEEILKFMCNKFKIDEGIDIKSAINEIGKSVVLIPQMKNYIKIIDAIVWKVESPIPRKIEETVQELKCIVKCFDRVAVLDSFSVNVHNSLNVAPENFKACLEKVNIDNLDFKSCKSNKHSESQSSIKSIILSIL